MSEQYATTLPLTEGELEDMDHMVAMKVVATRKLQQLMEDAQLTLDVGSIQFMVSAGTAFDPETGEPYKVWALRANGWSADE